VAAVLARTGLSPPARILDAGCGRGRHSVVLAELGFDVVGVDSDEAALDSARARGSSDGHAPEFRALDLRELDFEDEFDLVISLYTAFGHDAADREHAEVLAGMARALRAGGQVAIETINRDGQLPILPGTAWELTEDGGIALDRYDFDPLTGTLVVQRTVVAPGRGSEPQTWRIRLFASEDLAALLAGAGLECIGVSAGFESDDEHPTPVPLKPYVPSSRRIMLTGRKRGTGT
jgi:SAM-dependent methyltransferase